MATSETLSNMTDSARFEAIGSAFLRTAYPHLKTLLDIGTNAQGKTRKSKLDGICRYERNKYAGVDYTTNKSNLEIKWLSEGKRNLGDLPKAINKIAKIKSAHPAAEFQLYLITNQRLPEDLADEVYAFPTPEHIEVILIDNSTLEKFLDFDPIGQYIRQQLLQIEATLLSQPLLKDIVKRNIANYRFLTSPNDSIADIKSRREFLTNLQQRSNKVILLVGESGSGKSTLLYQLMVEEQEKGKVVIHLHEDAIRES
jgi:ABC-type multidrug transport system fused ATPase/permease subunit